MPITSPDRFRQLAQRLAQAALPALLMVLSLPSSARAQAAPAGPPPTCSTPDHRAFDFWVGDWNVTVAGKQAGTNLVTLEDGGCVVHEHWVGAQGGTGQSMNFYDRRTGEWNQVWVDSSGGVLKFTGAIENGALHYKTTTKRPDGTVVEHRLVFTPNADGSVRQLWETSADGGKSWSVAFDGLYRKKAG